MIIILSFRVGISKKKSIDHGVKKTCFIMSTHVTYEIDHTSLLCILCNISSKKKEIFICEISNIIILICQKLGLVRPEQEKIKFPSPYV